MLLRATISDAYCIQGRTWRHTGLVYAHFGQRAWCVSVTANGRREGLTQGARAEALQGKTQAPELDAGCIAQPRALTWYALVWHHGF